MQFDNGMFAFEVPVGWSAEESEDGNVYVTTPAQPEVWVSVEALGVDGAGKQVDAIAFVRKTYEDKLRLPNSLEAHGQDGRYIIRWKEVRDHDGVRYSVSHGLAAWNQSPLNLQLLMFQAACPLQLENSPVALEAEALAWGVPAELHFHTWRKWGVRPNPSLERTSTGKALGPRSGQCHHPLRGPSTFPVGSAQLKR